MAKFAAGVTGTGGIYATGVVDNGSKFATGVVEKKILKQKMS